MSTVDRPPTQALPDLIEGQSLDQPTFNRRYAAMPHGTRAELIGGVVHMPSPLFRKHSREDSAATGWLLHYERFTPGVETLSNVSTILGAKTEVQPDVQLRRLEESGGRTRDVDGYVVGPPELVVEVSDSSRARDLGPKKGDYEAAGVLEYLFVGLDPSEVRWFILRDGQYDELAPDPAGVIRSEAFPGLWLDVAALLARDLHRMFATLDRGLATPEHADFVASLARA